MKTRLNLLIFAATLAAATALAQPSRPPAAPKTTGDYQSDISTISEAQAQALQQAHQALAETEDARTHSALDAAIKEMQKAQKALEAAKGSPEKLAPALTAEQTAYQALLKVTPREYRVSRARNGNGSGEPNQRQLDQLDMKEEANRYETERQASTTPNQQQREQSELANRLKELAQRQQDLNDRLRELQTALQAAKNDEEREDIQRQLKRLRDEERQMLADVDELRQKAEQSPNANAEARQQLDQTRSQVQRAAQEMERDSPSQALAAGTRAQQSMQNLREDLRRQSSSQFTDQMREMRNQARHLAKQEEEISKKIDSLQNGERKLDNSKATQQLAEQLAKQQTALTNLLSSMRAVSEQSENIEPLLSQKLYDTLRRADQGRTDEMLQMSAQLAQRGFLPQTSEVERSARTNINELRQGVESAAESVLGNESETLRYAQKELDDLTRQMEQEVRAGGTNAAQSSFARSGNENGTNRLSAAANNSSNREGTNSTATAANGQPGNRGAQRPGQQSQQQGSQQAQNNSQRGQPGERNSQNRSGNPQPGNQGEQTSAQNSQPGQNGEGDNQENAQAQNGSGQNQGQQANNNSPGQQRGDGQGQNGQNQNEQAQGANAGGRGNQDRLTQLARELNNGGNNNSVRGGADTAGGERGGPITGGDYVNWADRMRDVEQVLDQPDLRYQLATVRERASALRQQFRQSGRAPDDNVVRQQLLVPMTQVRVWLQQEMARQQNANSLVPLDRDPVPDNYSELVRKYYEKLGSAQ